MKINKRYHQQSDCLKFANLNTAFGNSVVFPQVTKRVQLTSWPTADGPFISHYKKRRNDVQRRITSNERQRRNSVGPSIPSSLHSRYFPCKKCVFLTYGICSKINNKKLKHLTFIFTFFFKDRQVQGKDVINQSCVNSQRLLGYKLSLFVFKLGTCTLLKKKTDKKYVITLPV